MTLLDDYLALINRQLDELLNDRVPPADVSPTRLHEAIRWSLFGGGKRIRPAILIATGEAFGAERHRLMRSAAAIEMIHTYSLIHDDLPSMDDDDLRRGKATCHKQFGESTAILAGDVLQTLAFKTIADDEGLDAQMRVLLISMFADGAGTPRGMVAGQQLDLEGEGQELTLDAIGEIHSRKTGALISVAAAAGAMIGEASTAEMDAVAEYAAHLGLLFQITDDVLDVTQKTETLGKTAGKDAAQQKATFPGLLGVSAARDLAESVYQSAVDALVAISVNTGMLAAIAGRVVSRVQ